MALEDSTPEAGKRKVKVNPQLRYPQSTAAHEALSSQESGSRLHQSEIEFSGAKSCAGGKPQSTLCREGKICLHGCSHFLRALGLRLPKPMSSQFWISTTLAAALTSWVSSLVSLKCSAAFEGAPHLSCLPAGPPGQPVLLRK